MSKAMVGKIDIVLSKSWVISIDQDLIDSWKDTYPQEFLIEEFKKARSWLIANKHKAPKSQYGRFFNNWFSRSWEQYRKTLKSNPVKLTEDDMKDILKGDD